MKTLRFAAAACAAAALCCCETNVVIGSVPDAGLDAEVEFDASRMDADLGPADGAARDAQAPPERDAEPEGLPKVNWPTGAHSGNELQTYLDFGSWRGRSLDLAHVFVDRGQGWDGVVNPNWPVDMMRDFPGRLLISVPLYPDGEGNNRDCAAGAYDNQWRRLGSFLVDHDRANAIIRLGWGPNDLNHAWRADPDPSNWIGCFRRAVDAIRAGAPNAKIDWSFNPLGPPNVIAGDPFRTYPGDAYVDFIGIEAFDRYPASLTRAEWDEHCKAPTGLCSVIDFVRQHGKKLGIAEWGVDSCGASSGGDNSLFIERMVRTFAANQDIMGYEAYFEDDGSEVCSSLYEAKQNPSAAGLYKQIYAAR